MEEVVKRSDWIHIDELVEQYHKFHHIHKRPPSLIIVHLNDFERLKEYWKSMFFVIAGNEPMRFQGIEIISSREQNEQKFKIV